MSDETSWPQHIVDAACAGTATFERDRALYAVISRHGFRPVVWAIKPEEEADLAAEIARIFSFEPQAKVEADAEHAPLFRAIRQSSDR